MTSVLAHAHTHKTSKKKTNLNEKNLKLWD